MRRFARNLGGEEKRLYALRDDLAGLTISEASFTSFTYVLAVAYNEAEAFVLKELGDKAAALSAMADGIVRDAGVWQDAEDAGASAMA